MKAWRDGFGITSVLCQIWSRARRGLFVVALLQARGTTIANSPHFPGPHNAEPAQPTATGSPGEGKTTFSHKPVASALPRQGQGRSWSCNSALPSPPGQGCLCPHTHCPAAGLGMWLSPANPMGLLHLLGHPGGAAVPLSHSVPPGPWAESPSCFGINRAS